MLDATGAQALGEIVEELESRGITVLLKGVRPHHRRILEAVGTLDRLAHQRHLFDNLDDALAHARIHLARTPHQTSASGSPGRRCERQPGQTVTGTPTLATDSRWRPAQHRVHYLANIRRTRRQQHRRSSRHPRDHCRVGSRDRQDLPKTNDVNDAQSGLVTRQ